MSPKSKTMHYYVLNLTYIRPLAEVEAVLDTPIPRYIESAHQRGAFLLSGREGPWTGGIIFAQAASRDDLERIIAEDPFLTAQVATYETRCIPSPREQALIWHQWSRTRAVDEQVFTQEGRVRMSDERTGAAAGPRSCHHRDHHTGRAALSRFAGNLGVGRSSPENPWGFSSCGVSSRLKNGEAASRWKCPTRFWSRN